MKTLGILGGVGPSTTANIYLSIIEGFRKQGETNYPSIVIQNLAFPFSIEYEVIVMGINSEKMLPYLIEGAQKLEKVGASFGILPCNTLHKYLEDIKKSVGIPFISILDESADYLNSMNLTKVGVLGTKTTVVDKLYSKPLALRGIEAIYPKESNQDLINNMITKLIEGKEFNYVDQINQVCLNLREEGAEGILLACTDLQALKNYINVFIPVIDTTTLIINASIRELIKK